jgi:hypothetical protein
MRNLDALNAAVLDWRYDDKGGGDFPHSHSFSARVTCLRAVLFHPSILVSDLNRIYVIATVNQQSRSDDLHFIRFSKRDSSLQHI